ncbi:fluoride efflux transporter FluC [Agrococcus sp. SGAir0287]|uniref:fluoride efflux transporter FluC n=1 Tax=Agrococcus sp. SGAir0287 TaxID=2070347 RepID=UPI0010CCCD55|nr:CrcB family protein [Agrococcus sp. SGAir0287]QCR19188.1 chromosome condensation protein CrcB [Agrococcus sp. SGAir0287]
MTALLVALTAFAGGAGAASRYLVDAAITARTRLRFPIATAVINLTGSAALGVVTGLAGANAVGAEATTIIGVGFLGGYTTFSTTTVEIVRLLLDRKPLSALANSVGLLVGGIALAAAGLALGLGLALGSG